MKKNNRDKKSRKRWKWVIPLSILAVVGIALLTLDRTIQAPELPPEEPEEIEQTGGHKAEVYTVLVVGTDQEKSNTDTIMVGTYDSGAQTLHVMSIPRDTMVNAPWDIKRINSVYSRDGIAGLQSYLKTLIGFQPDFYVSVDLGAFVELVDLIGGVEFDVPRNMKYSDPYQDLYIDLKKGVQTLDGESAMELVRFRRYSDGDIGRIQVQQDFLKALMTQCLSVQNWSKVSEYIQLFNKYVESDLELTEMMGIGRQMMGIDMANVSFQTMPGNYYAQAWSHTYHIMQSYVTPDGPALLELVNEKLNPYQQPVTMEQLDLMSINADGSVSSSTGTVADEKATQPTPVQETKPDPTLEPAPETATEPVEQPLPSTEPAGEAPTEEAPDAQPTPAEPEEPQPPAPEEPGLPPAPEQPQEPVVPQMTDQETA